MDFDEIVDNELEIKVHGTKLQWKFENLKL